MGFTTTSNAFADFTDISQEIKSPLKQIQNTHPTNVVCKEDLVLRFKYDNKPVCMDIFTIVKIKERAPEYFTVFNMGEYPLIGSWNPNLENSLTYDSNVPHSNDQPLPQVGSIFWYDDKTKYEIKYMMINGFDLIMYSMNLLQDVSDRHTFPIEVVYRGNEDTILIFQIPDDLQLENGVGMHMGQFDRQNILFPFVEPESKTKRQIIISGLYPEENGLTYIEFAFLNKDSRYELTEIPMSSAKKYLSENSINLDNLPESYCNVKGGQYKDKRCSFENTSLNYDCDAWNFYITAQCKP